LSLGALAIAIVVSCTIRLHVGFLAISLAWIVGVYIADMSAAEVMSGFPTRLFLTLAGVTLLFSQAQANGTLDLIAHKAVLLCRGNVGVMPMMFFLLSFVLASIGPGNIAATALMAPMGMAVAGQVGIPAFSTLGALCMAAAHPSVDTRDLFNKLMAWGLSMTVVGGLVSWLLFSVLGIGV
jgi:di/tricarboxylate transporter